MLGLLLGLPYAPGKQVAEQYSRPGWTLTRVRELAELAAAPGTFFGFGNGLLGVVLNALLWAGTIFVFTSPNRGRSAVVAKGLTGVLWALWVAFAFVAVGLMYD